MKQTKFYLAAIAMLLTVNFSHAQTVDEVINKHIDAIGGKAIISQITSIVTEGTMEVMGGSNPSKTYLVTGKGFKNEVDFNGNKIMSCVTDKGGWSINPMTGASIAQPLSSEEFNAEKSSIFPGGPLFDYAAKGSKAELLANEKVADKDALKIKLTTDAGVEYTYWLDPSTYYILKSEKIAGGQLTSSMLSDYKKTDFGYTMAYAAEITLPQGFTINSKLTKVDINTNVDLTVFDMPK